jgi:hypothetical protein
MMRAFVLGLVLLGSAHAQDVFPTRMIVHLAAYYPGKNDQLHNVTPGLGLAWGRDHGPMLGAYRNAYDTLTYYAGYSKGWAVSGPFVASVSAGLYKNESREGVHGFLVPSLGVQAGRTTTKLSYIKKNCFRCTETWTLSTEYRF